MNSPDYGQVFLEATKDGGIGAFFTDGQIQIVLAGIGKGVESVACEAAKAERLRIMTILKGMERNKKIPLGIVEEIDAELSKHM